VLNEIEPQLTTVHERLQLSNADNGMSMMIELQERMKVTAV
jgi:hypothetical protein